MNSRKTIEGQWQVDGADATPLPGTLEFDPEKGLTLKASRHRTPNAAAAFAAALNTTPVPTQIRGTDGHGRRISLFGCFQSHSNSQAALDQLTIEALVGLVGEHYEQGQNPEFLEATATFSALDSWLPRSALVRDTGPNGLLRVTQAPLADIQVQLSESVSLTITSTISQQTSDFGAGVAFRQKQSVLFRFTTPQTPETIVSDYIYRFCNFLTFAVGSTVFIEDVKFASRDNPTERVDLLQANPGVTQTRASVLAHNCVVQAQEIGANLPALILRWFNLFSGMEAVLNLYFTARNNSAISASTQFLMLAQALEAYHGRSDQFVHEVQPSAVFRQRRRALVAAVPEGEQAWLTEKLNFANQKNLADRLAELIQDQIAYVPSFIPDREVFANVVRWTRNYYTHYSPDEENREVPRIAEGADLVRYAIRMQTLLSLLFSRDLQLPAATADRIVQRTSQVQIVTTH